MVYVDMLIIYLYMYSLSIKINHMRARIFLGFFFCITYF